MKISLVFSLIMIYTAYGFIATMSLRRKVGTKYTAMNMIFSKELDYDMLSIIPTKHIQTISMFLSDTSISEEDVINVTGQTANLPDPLIPVGIAAIIFLGVGILQFSLGDLTKEEGQARVRDFLQTKKNTERKRGYFD